MGKFILSHASLDDLDLIWAYIAHDNPAAADCLIEAAYQTCRILAANPELGRRHRFPENAPTNIRPFVITDFPNYIIFYRVEPEAVQIVRVLHGARNTGEFFDRS